MKTNAVMPPPAVKDNSGCAHHWIIDSARGQSSKGKCRRCGAIKDFDNRGTDFFYDPEASPLVVENKKPWQPEDEEPQWEVA